MFTWLNKQGVKSDKGFVVQSVARNTIEYREDLKKIAVYVEGGALPDGRYCIDIAPNAFSRWDGEATILSEEKQKEMLKNFTDAMEFQGLLVLINEDMDQHGDTTYDFQGFTRVESYVRDSEGNWKKKD